jgi:hypothetical protein
MRFVFYHFLSRQSKAYKQWDDVYEAISSAIKKLHKIKSDEKFYTKHHKLQEASMLATLVFLIFYYDKGLSFRYDEERSDGIEVFFDVENKIGIDASSIKL